MIDSLQGLGLLASAGSIRRRGIKENIAFVESLGDIVGKTYRSHKGTGYVGTLTHIKAGYFDVTATIKLTSGIELMFPFNTLVEVTDEQ